MAAGRARSMSESIIVRFLNRADRDADRVALRTVKLNETSADVAMTWGQWRLRSLQFAAALVTRETAESDSVAILAGNTFEWPIADIGTLMGRKMSVGIYPTSASVQVERILLDSGAGLFISDDPRQLEVVVGMRARLPDLRVIVSLLEQEIPGTITWGEWLEQGQLALDVSPGFASFIESRARSVDRTDPAIIIYTSGSTGEAKGAVLSHGCLDASAESIKD